MIDLREHLQEHFGLDNFRPRQRDVIEDVLAGKDVLCVMPTGAGKSLCYQLPAVVRKGLTLVVSPLISLMEDQVTQMRDEGIAAAFLNSTLSPDLQREVISELAGGFEGLLYVAPERFASDAFREILPKLKISLLAIDEAHCISMWGHDFRPDYANLGKIRALMNHPPTIALTATATEDVRADIIHLLQLHEPSVVITGFDRINLRYECRSFDKKTEKDSELVRYVKSQDGSGIVYCSTRKAVDALVATLSAQLRDRLVVGYHAGMHNEARSRSQEQWMNTPRAVAVATNAFGMGINKPDVRFVLHYNMPGTLEAYYQEAGRAGRDGQISRCMLFYHFEDTRTQQFFITKIGEDRPEEDFQTIQKLKSRAEQKLKLMEKYVFVARCRRQQILDYFGDDAEVENCQCDLCKPGGAGELVQTEMDEQTITQIRQLLSCVARVNGKFGIFLVAEILAGEKTERVVQYGFDQLKLFGVFAKAGIKKVVAAVHRLIDVGLVRQFEVGEDIRVVELTGPGVKVMKAEELPPISLSELNLHKPTRKRERSGSRAEGTNPRALGTNPRALGTNPIALGTNPRALGTNPKAKRAKELDESSDALDTLAQARFDRLRSMRAELARAADLPAYCVLHDKTMKQIATIAPSDLPSLERIKGMGPFKISLYGQAILDALKAE